MKPARSLLHRAVAPGVVLSVVFATSAFAQTYWTYAPDTTIGQDAGASNIDRSSSVALTPDGRRLVIGLQARGTAGGAWVWERDSASGTWNRLVGKMSEGWLTTDSGQGAAVAVSADGGTFLVGSPAYDGNRGRAWVWRLDSTQRDPGKWHRQWYLQDTLFDAGPVSRRALQGAAVALSADGNTAVVGGPQDGTGAGAAWIWTRAADGTWSDVPVKLTAGSNSHLGASVSISGDGNTVAVGGPRDGNNTGAAWVWRRDAATKQWPSSGTKLVGTNGTGAAQGTSVALSADGSTLAVGGPNDSGIQVGTYHRAGFGAIWIWTRNAATGTWSQQGGKLTDTTGGPAYLGSAVALSGDGNFLAAGAPSTGTVGDGSVRVWTRDASGSWSRVGDAYSVPRGPLPGYYGQGHEVAISATGRRVVYGGIYPAGLASATVLERSVRDTSLLFLDMDARLAPLPSKGTDWSPGAYKAECSVYHNATGITTSVYNGGPGSHMGIAPNYTESLTCGPGAIAGRIAEGVTCRAVPSNWNDQGPTMCNPGEYVAGISQLPSTPSTGSPVTGFKGMLCCAAANIDYAHDNLDTLAPDASGIGIGYNGPASAHCGPGRYIVGFNRRPYAPDGVYCAGAPLPDDR